MTENVACQIDINTSFTAHEFSPHLFYLSLIHNLLYICTHIKHIILFIHYTTHIRSLIFYYSYFFFLFNYNANSYGDSTMSQ